MTRASEFQPLDSRRVIMGIARRLERLVLHQWNGEEGEDQKGREEGTKQRSGQSGDGTGRPLTQSLARLRGERARTTQGHNAGRPTAWGVYHTR